MLTLEEYERIRVAIGTHLARISVEVFRPEMKLTLVARHPTNPECHVTVTDDDDLDAVARLLASRSS